MDSQVQQVIHSPKLEDTYIIIILIQNDSKNQQDGTETQTLQLIDPISLEAG